jgi:16S rRNA (guanine(966)-N(2))-methyltransferase RsmD
LSSLRVNSGIAKGRKLYSVPGDTTRPITDRTKVSLFNIIGNDLADAKFLDLFAGTGSVGIEALSRGAQFCRFLDINHQAIETIRKNLKLTGLELHAEVLRKNAIQYLSQPPDQKFDYVYVAPPQYKEIWLKTLSTLESNTGWLNDDAWVIVQIHPVEYKTIKLDHLGEFDQRKYGSTLLIFIKLKS